MQHRFLFTPVFNCIVSLVIVGDAVMLGVNASDRGTDSPFIWAANSATAIFMVCEVLLKLNTFGKLFLRDPWNVIDCICVWVVVFDSIECTVYGNSIRSLWLRSFSLVRIPRCGRAVQKVSIKNQSVLAHIMLNLKLLLPLTVYSLCFLSLLSFIAGMILSSDALPHLSELRVQSGGGWLYGRSFLGDISRSIFSSFQVLTLDSWFSQIQRPLINGNRWIPVCAFVFIILGGSIMYTGLLIGAFVDKAQKTSRIRSEASNLEEGKKRVLIRDTIHKELLTEFGESDIGVDEVISFANCREDVTRKFRELDITEEELGALWKTLDPNGMDRIPIAKVRHALERLHASGRGRDLLELQSSLSHAIVGANRIRTRANSLNETLTRIEGTVRKINIHLNRPDN